MCEERIIRETLRKEVKFWIKIGGKNLRFLIDLFPFLKRNC